MTSGLLSAQFGAAAVDAQLTDEALVAAMLDVEVALARACAAADLVPAAAADAIAGACDPARFDLTELRARVADSGNPVVPLVGQLGRYVGAEAEAWVHFGATSQDVLDTALMLVARRASAPMLEALDSAMDHCAGQAEAFATTPMLARTLGQPAEPTSFGLVAAGWLGGLRSAAWNLDRVCDELPVSLGGPAGTRSAFGDHGAAVLGGLAAALDLQAPLLPWHTDRSPVLDLGAALVGVLQATGKIGLDIERLTAAEVGELQTAGTATGRRHEGGSSAMPHKHNQIDAILLVAAARRAPGPLATLAGAGLHEHQRATGSWHAEWLPLLELLHLAGGAAGRVDALVHRVVPQPDRMRANLDATGGRVLASSVAARLAAYVGRAKAHELVGGAARADGSFRESLLAVPEVREHLGESGVDDALDPAGAVHAAATLVDQAVAAHRASPGSPDAGPVDNAGS